MNKPPTILVIDDDDDLRETVCMLLMLAGYDVTAAANGREALDLLESAEVPNLILLDLMMPLMDGWQFRAEQKKRAKLANLPVLLLTASRNLGKLPIDVDAKDILLKPFASEDLLGAVRRHCAS